MRKHFHRLLCFNPLGFCSQSMQCWIMKFGKWMSKLRFLRGILKKTCQSKISSQMNKTLALSQTAYIDKILPRFGMELHSPKTPEEREKK